MTTDYGETWKPLAKRPAGRRRGRRRAAVVEEPEACCSPAPSSGCTSRSTAARRGTTSTETGLPTGVRVDDLVIHPRERELVIGTHGRGIWVMDIAPLEQLTEKVLAADAHLFDVKPSVAVKVVPRPAPGKGAEPVGKAFAAANPPPGVPVTFYLGKGVPKAEVVLTDKAGKSIASKAFDSPTVGVYTAALVAPPGEYTVTLKAGAATKTGTAVVTKEGEMPADD